MRDRARGALIVFAVVFAAGVVGLLATGALDERRLAFTLGVQPTQVAAVVEPQQTACQGPIDVPAGAGSVRFPVGTFARPGPALEVQVRTATGVAGRATVAPGYGDNTTVAASAGGIEAGRRVALCVHNSGRRKVALYGGAPQAARTSFAVVDGRPAGSDLTLVFERSHERSMLSALPDALERATLFHPSWVGRGLLWALAGLLLVALPGALMLALRAALRDTPSPEGLTEPSVSEPARRTD